MTEQFDTYTSEDEELGVEVNEESGRKHISYEKIQRVLSTFQDKFKFFIHFSYFLI